MPRLEAPNLAPETEGPDGAVTTQIKGGSYTFTNTSLIKLIEPEYTLFCLAIDATISMKNDIEEVNKRLKAIIKGIDQVATNLVRVVIFSSSYGIQELHGYKPITEIDPDKDYQPIKARGSTNLIDAIHSGIGSAITLGTSLRKSYKQVNAIVVVLTDGEENSSNLGIPDILALSSDLTASEKMDSMLTMLIGFRVQTCDAGLRKLAADANIDVYVPFFDVEEGTFGTIAGLISQSVNSTSSARGTGGPSQKIVPGAQSVAPFTLISPSF